jgi:hypothetical protein
MTSCPNATGHGSHEPNRNEKIQIIAAYIGYDDRLSFGANELGARMRAKRSLSPVVPLAQPVHTALGETVRGYVAGIPDDRAKKIAHLEARERLSAEQMAAENLLSKDESLSLDERFIHQETAKVMRAGLDLLRDEIAAIR